MTGDWEFKLRQIGARQTSRAEFMSEIADMTRHIVERAKKFEEDTIPGDFGVLKMPCPKCGGEVHEKYKQFQCVNEKCDFAIWKTLCSRMFEMEEVEKLITEKQVGPLQGFRSKQGFPFAAVLKLNAEFKMEFDFGNGQKARTARHAAPVDFTGKEPLGKCPKCGARVFDAGMNYICEKATGPDRTCKFRTGKIILQQDIAPAQVKKLLAEGKTDLLKRFISKKTNRKFEAFLVVKDGGTAFEFPPRERKTKAKGGERPRSRCRRLISPARRRWANVQSAAARFLTPRRDICARNRRRIPSRAGSRSAGKFCSSRLSRRRRKSCWRRARPICSANSSPRPGRPFPAYLVMDDKGKVTFDFPPREGETELK